MAKDLRESIENAFFKTDDGMITFAWLLEILNHFAMTTDNPEVAIRQNIAKEILTMCNRWEGVDVQTYIRSLPRVIKEKESE